MSQEKVKTKNHSLLIMLLCATIAISCRCNYSNKATDSNCGYMICPNYRCNLDLTTTDSVIVYKYDKLNSGERLIEKRKNRVLIKKIDSINQSSNAWVFFLEDSIDVRFNYRFEIQSETKKASYKIGDIKYEKVLVENFYSCEITSINGNKIIGANCIDLK